jgi:hypothetical protein
LWFSRILARDLTETIWLYDGIIDVTNAVVVPIDDLL